MEPLDHGTVGGQAEVLGHRDDRLRHLPPVLGAVCDTGTHVLQQCAYARLPTLPTASQQQAGNILNFNRGNSHDNIHT